MAPPPKEFRSFPLNSQIQLIKHFVKRVSDSSANSPLHLQKYANSANNLIQDLGIQERDFPPPIRDIAQDLKKHFLLLFKRCGGTEEDVLQMAGPILMLILSPVDISMRTGSSLIDGIGRKLFLKANLENVGTVDKNRQEINQSTRQALENLEEENSEKKKRLESLTPENIETLEYTNKILRDTAANLREKAANSRSSVNVDKINELLNRHSELKRKNGNLTKGLGRISYNDTLPPNLTLSREILAERKTYLNRLIVQITDMENCDAISFRSSSSFS